MTTAMPTNAIITAFDNATLTCVVLTVGDGEPEIKYTWHRVGGDIQKKAKGKNAATLIIPSVVPEDEGEYYCKGVQFGHCAESKKINLTVDGEMYKAYSYRLLYYLQQLIRLQKIHLHKFKYEITGFISLKCLYTLGQVLLLLTNVSNFMNACT